MNKYEKEKAVNRAITEYLEKPGNIIRYYLPHERTKTEQDMEKAVRLEA